MEPFLFLGDSLSFNIVFMKLHWKIIVAMIVGVGVGFLFHSSGYQDNTFYDLIILLGDLFIRLLKMVIARTRALVVVRIIQGINPQKNHWKDVCFGIYWRVRGRLRDLRKK